MIKRSVLILPIVVVMLVVIAAVLSYSQRSKVSDSFAGTKLFPTLDQQLNNVARLELVDASATITIHKTDETWWVKQAFDYYADLSSVKQVLLQLAQLEIIEPKTKKSENYSKLGVAEPKDGTSNKLSVFDEKGNILASVVLGNRKPSGMAGVASLYVRKTNEEQVWLVKGDVTLPASNAWQDKTVLNIAADRISAVTILAPKQQVLALEKAKKEDKNFVVKNLPKAKQLKSDDIVNTLASSLQNLRMQEVLPKAEFKADPATFTLADFDTFDNIRISVQTLERENKIYSQFEAKMRETNTPMTQEVSDLNKRLSGWVFVISSAQAQNFRKKIDDLIAPVAASVNKKS